MTDKKEEKVVSRKQAITSFVLRTLFYFAILIALIYLYEYSGIDSVHFIYNEF
ncbi:teichoic acid D-Ala incorporation-associated protein DltX [Lactobacillus psittaci]|uniref:teichoic acid D-Ala incorporation-associated protein DltX n=1 Tax=Lactobacillus psittaci TaxID=116089 RepID=UPI0009DBFB5C|nr:teichoic acid D-Ala incorporation-associated protein DltX [Lactobacillus psittaci]